MGSWYETPLFRVSQNTIYSAFWFSLLCVLLSLEIPQAGVVFRNSGVTITQMKMGRSVWEASACEEERCYNTLQHKYTIGKSKFVSPPLFSPLFHTLLILSLPPQLPSRYILLLNKAFTAFLMWPFHTGSQQSCRRGSDAVCDFHQNNVLELIHRSHWAVCLRPSCLAANETGGSEQLKPPRGRIWC